MLSSFIMNLREGVEMALIVAIILAYLARTGLQQYFRHVWAGVGLALAVCIAAGAILFRVLGAHEGSLQMMIEGFTMLVAVGVLTTMIFWMRRASANISRTLRERVDAAVAGNSMWAMPVLAFVSVLREGVESVLFTIAAGESSSPGSAAIGAVLGLAVAALFGVAIYRGARFLNLKAFFHWTAVFLIIVCAGLLSGAIREFHELGWIPRIVSYVWDTSGWLSEDSLGGGILRSLLGYDSSPSLAQVLAYWSYLVVVLGLFLRPVRLAKKPALA
ncbi:MAG: iron uptake transporter permease EfeU [Mycobacterium leprae]